MFVQLFDDKFLHSALLPFNNKKLFFLLFLPLLNVLWKWNSHGYLEYNENHNKMINPPENVSMDDKIVWNVYTGRHWDCFFYDNINKKSITCLSEIRISFINRKCCFPQFVNGEISVACYHNQFYYSWNDNLQLINDNHFLLIKCFNLKFDFYLSKLGYKTKFFICPATLLAYVL